MNIRRKGHKQHAQHAHRQHGDGRGIGEKRNKESNDEMTGNKIDMREGEKETGGGMRRRCKDDEEGARRRGVWRWRSEVK